MARIPDEQIERLKQEVSRVRLVERQGYKPKRQGKDYVIHCPFHEDETPSTESAKPIKRNTTVKHPQPLAADPDQQATLKRVIDYYHECLKNAPEALAYLESRGLQSAELIDHFKLGYANRTLGYRLPEKNPKAGADIRGQLQTIGILRKSGHEHFRGQVFSLR
jgi:DNA primase